MLLVTIPSIEQWNEETCEFTTSKPCTLQIEHSLVSLSKWESKWCKPFLVKNAERTVEENIDYIRCMTITQNVDPTVYQYITSENLKQVNAYIDAPMTATTFPRERPGTNQETPTAEVIYYWMVALEIPFECQRWHLNRLMTLIKVCNLKSQPPKKMGRNELLSRNAALNEARKKHMNTRG